MTDAPPVRLQALTAALDKLPTASDRTFARSLANQFSQRGLSAKQWEWVDRLLERATTPQAEPTRVDLTGVVALLNRAGEHLKAPAVLMMVNEPGGRHRTLRLSIAGARAGFPGSVNVASAGSFSDRDWYGRVHTDGRFEPCRRFPRETQTAVTTALQAIALDPAGACAAYGHLTGVCAFCNRALDDERSTAVGYGPVCAKHYGLPWGTRAAAAALAA